MIVVANRFEVGEGYGDQFVERFRGSVGSVEDREGFVGFELLAPIRGDVYVAKTYWETVEDFEAWTASEAFEGAHSGDAPEGMFESHPDLEIHEVAVERGRN